MVRGSFSSDDIVKHIYTDRKTQESLLRVKEPLKRREERRSVSWRDKSRNHPKTVNENVEDKDPLPPRITSDPPGDGQVRSCPPCRTVVSLCVISFLSPDEEGRWKEDRGIVRGSGREKWNEADTEGSSRKRGENLWHDEVTFLLSYQSYGYSFSQGQVRLRHV